MSIIQSFEIIITGLRKRSIRWSHGVKLRVTQIKTKSQILPTQTTALPEAQDFRQTPPRGHSQQCSLGFHTLSSKWKFQPFLFSPSLPRRTGIMCHVVEMAVCKGFCSLRLLPLCSVAHRGCGEYTLRWGLSQRGGGRKRWFREPGSSLSAPRAASSWHSPALDQLPSLL